jgi:DNA-binding transcriptional ArsR family regulator
MSNKSIYELINVFEVSLDDILVILKAISNEKRLLILIALLTGEKSFTELKTETQLKKDHNEYQLTSDGALFVRAVESAYTKSEIKEKRTTEALQKRQFSEPFIRSFFRK